MQLDPEKLRQRLKPLFQENFDKRGELGAAVSVWQNGKPIVDLYGGFRDAGREKLWTADTVVLVWSATKGIGSACVLHALQQRKIELNRRVAEFWPEFGQADKDKITLGQLLSHQAGLCALDQRIDVLDYDGVIRALEAQAPLWPPGTAHGYHARTFGFLLDELMRRITGKTLSDYWREIFARPLELDFWIGLPEEQNSRVATIYAAKSGKPPEPAQFYRDLVTPGTLARKTFTSPCGLNVIRKMNDPHIRAESIVSFGGIGSASALAKFYSMLANGGEFNGQSFFFPRNDRTDDNDIIGWQGPCFSNPNRILRRVYERLTRCSAQAVRTIRNIFRTSRCWRQPCLCRSGKQNGIRVHDEPNGTIGSAEGEIATIGGRNF
jgi:CubicO group peptidase (beta-lactamase class C family)